MNRYARNAYGDEIYPNKYVKTGDDEKEYSATDRYGNDIHLNRYARNKDHDEIYPRKRFPGGKEIEFMIGNMYAKRVNGFQYYPRTANHDEYTETHKYALQNGNEIYPRKNHDTEEFMLCNRYVRKWLHNEVFYPRDANGDEFHNLSYCKDGN